MQGGDGGDGQERLPECLLRVLEGARGSHPAREASVGHRRPRGVSRSCSWQEGYVLLVYVQPRCVLCMPCVVFSGIFELCRLHTKQHVCWFEDVFPASLHFLLASTTHALHSLQPVLRPYQGPPIALTGTRQRRAEVPLAATLRIQNSAQIVHII